MKSYHNIRYDMNEDYHLKTDSNMSDELLFFLFFSKILQVLCSIIRGAAKYPAKFMGESDF